MSDLRSADFAGWIRFSFPIDSIPIDWLSASCLHPGINYPRINHQSHKCNSFCSIRSFHCCYIIVIVKPNPDLSKGNVFSKGIIFTCSAEPTGAIHFVTKYGTSFFFLWPKQYLFKFQGAGKDNRREKCRETSKTPDYRNPSPTLPFRKSITTVITVPRGEEEGGGWGVHCQLGSETRDTEEVR